MMLTPWGEVLDAHAPLPEYPRPQLVRGDWLCLNGQWRHAVTPFPDADPLACADPVAPRRSPGNPDRWPPLLSRLLSSAAVLRASGAS